ncbi:hypothetical protein WJX73_008188 [Symbiochloris irregularis]|uniref:Uncharacterized protein n=1 Tax=Symbiochloris irregularis TaxID=706552 RepID=A0AAW1PQU2_9CHLO
MVNRLAGNAPPEASQKEGDHLPKSCAFPQRRNALTQTPNFPKFQKQVMSAAAPEEAPLDCYAPGDTGLLGLRLGGLFGILAVSTIGVAIPYFAYSAKLHSTFFLLRAFAAGVVLTTGYVHVLGDAYPILTDPCLGLSTDYPWAMTFATASTLFTFTLEWTLHKHFVKRLNRPQRSASTLENGEQSNGTLEQKDATLEDGMPKDLLATKGNHDPGRVKVILNTVHSYTFEIGIIFHSIFIGITLGISQNANTVTSLMIALFFHQGNEGLALGVLFVKAEYSRLKYIILAFCFVIVTPLGVGIGIGVSSGYNGESKAALGNLPDAMHCLS